jgi:hypothetical protein
MKGIEDDAEIPFVHLWTLETLPSFQLHEKMPFL